MADQGAGKKRRRLLVAVAIGLAILVIPSIVAYLWLVKSHPVYRAVVSVVEAHAGVGALLGGPLEWSFWPYGRVVRGGARFETGLTGPRGRAQVVASARRQEQGGWRFDFIRVTRGPDGRTVTLRRDELAGVRVDR